MKKFSYKSFCWSFGTTSFRTKNFNKTIEQQLLLLNKFWNVPGHEDISWKNNQFIQEQYYEFLHQHGFLIGDANRKDKDAREKTSGLVDIGLINEDRLLTNVGINLLNIVNKDTIGRNKLFCIPDDSFIYLKQLLKCGVGIDGKFIRPLVAIIYALLELSYLSYEEFIYLIPLVIDKYSLKDIINSIKEIRVGNKSIDDVVISRLLSMRNYHDALGYLLSNKISEEIICEIGMNRKSRKYDKIYYKLYIYLFDKYINNSKCVDKKIVLTIDKIANAKISSFWKKLLFCDDINYRNIYNNSKEIFKINNFNKVQNEIEFKIVFFEYMHLIKAKATLLDYFDLNTRYLRTTNCMTFNDRKVQLDTIPSIIFQNAKDDLYEILDEKSDNLYLDVPISEICNQIEIDDTKFVDLANKKFGKKFRNKFEVLTITEEIRYEKFNELINKLFSNETLIYLLDCFEKRQDNLIQNYINSEADIPTIFEYILGIIWYIISNRKGKILDYMRLSLDADLLPRTHAAGGSSDILYEYEKTEYFPAHTVLIEATLSENTGQRVMEMEPVSRHLGEHLIKYNNKYDYCAFITNYLNPNIISDFRSRKTIKYYAHSDSRKFISGMKIIPLETRLLKIILKNGYKYEQLYGLFENAYVSNEVAIEWYIECIENVIAKLSKI